MMERVEDRSENLERLKLVDPIDFAELLNSAALAVDTADIKSSGVRYIINEMLRLAAGKDEEGGAQMVGLAAPQVGENKRIVVIDTNAGGVERQAQHMEVLINPRITAKSEQLVDGREGCWSCDNFCANVPRASWVEVEALGPLGDQVHMKLEGFTARIVQHEIDHLNGIRCIDRVPIDEPWRLHYVRKDDPAEFERYRKEWASWQLTFPREDWDKFRKGIR